MGFACGIWGSQPFSWGPACKMPSFSKPFAPPLPSIVGTTVPARLPLSFLGSPLPQLLRGLSEPEPHSYMISVSHSALGWLSWDLSFPWARGTQSDCSHYFIHLVFLTGSESSDALGACFQTDSQRSWRFWVSKSGVRPGTGLANRYPTVIWWTKVWKRQSLLC